MERTSSYRDAEREPLEKGAIYVLRGRFYLIDKDIPTKPNQPLDVLGDNETRETLQYSALSHMFKLHDAAQKKITLAVLRQQANFLEKHL